MATAPGHACARARNRAGRPCARRRRTAGPVRPAAGVTRPTPYFVYGLPPKDRCAAMPQRRPIPTGGRGVSDPEAAPPWRQLRRSSWKKSLPLSSTMMKAGKSSTSMRQIASMPSSGKAMHSTLRMQSWASRAAPPPIEPR